MSEEKVPQKKGALCHPLSQLPYPMNDLGRRHLREAHFNYAHERGAAESASAGFIYEDGEERSLEIKNCREEKASDAKVRRKKG